MVMIGTILSRLSKAVAVAFLASLVIVVVYPLLWMFLNGFKSNAELFSDPFSLPTNLDPDAYAAAWEAGVRDYIGTSILVTVTSTITTVLISAWAAYGLSRISIPVNRFFVIVIMAALMLAPAVTLIPLVQLLQSMGIYNTWWALLVLYTAFRVPFTTFLIRSYMVDLPRDVDEAASIDGASQARIFWEIILPMCRPIVISAVLLHILFAWNEYLFALVFLGSSGDAATLPVGLTTLMGKQLVEYDVVFAGMTIAALPILILFFAGQRYFIRGLSDGVGK
jgi:raffinose/stachyose/melibiose transport system permease protein